MTKQEFEKRLMDVEAMPGRLSLLSGNGPRAFDTGATIVADSMKGMEEFICGKTIEVGKDESAQEDAQSSRAEVDTGGGHEDKRHRHADGQHANETDGNGTKNAKPNPTATHAKGQRRKS